ncbi:MAG: hypothetical protein PF545_07785 [Elusimicrobia bacterium]|jgi:hypothetical protein|nr:hypothetical protein [Elusimicrobiota bacterium]
MRKTSVRLNGILLVLFILFTGFFYSKMQDKTPYPPIFSKTYPLSTPLSFWASMMGMRRLATDIIWIQVIQYYGEPSGTHAELSSGRGHTEDTARTQKNKKKVYYPELKNYWQQIIRFDPLFANAYLIGPTTLGWNLKRYEEALDILNEGIKAIENIESKTDSINLRETDKYHPLIVGSDTYFNELKWKLYLLKSTLIYMNREELSKAIPQLEKIAFLEGTPINIKVILAQLYEQENKDNKKALNLWVNIYNNAQRESRKISALKNIKRLEKLISSG